jgi:hypothetical protein
LRANVDHLFFEDVPVRNLLDSRDNQVKTRSQDLPELSELLNDPCFLFGDDPEQTVENQYYGD